MLLMMLLFLQTDPLAQAKVAYQAEDYQGVIDLLGGQVQSDPASVILLADAYFARAEAQDFAAAEPLYLRAIYELEDNPYPDHCYFRLARIYLAWDRNEDAQLYFSQLWKKYPKSTYVGESLRELAFMAQSEGNYDKVVSWALELLRSQATQTEKDAFAAFGPMLSSGTPGPGTLQALYQAHRGFILGIPPLAFRYAQWFQQLGDLKSAREIALHILNVYPRWKDSNTLSLDLLRWERAAGYPAATRFLSLQILANQPAPAIKAQIYQILLEEVQSGTIQMGGERPLPDYSEMAEFVIQFHPDDEVSNHFRYLQALTRGFFSEPLEGLTILRDLSEDQKLGAYSGLFRNHYHVLTHLLIDRADAAQQPQMIEAIYLRTKGYFENTVNTNYLQKVQRALEATGHLNRSLELYQAAWETKVTRSGFDLAFEPLLTQSLQFFDQLRLDTALARRLPQYEKIYGKRGKYLDQYRLIQTKHQLRSLPVEDLKKLFEADGLINQTRFDLQRLEWIELFGLEQGLDLLVDRCHAQMLAYPKLQADFPAIPNRIQAVRADRSFAVGNYRAAQTAYQKIMTNTQYSLEDQAWAQLQLARLYELEADHKTALRLYGQILYMQCDHVEWIQAFAARRMDAIAYWRQSQELKGALNLGL
ncbi:MAG: hypothetical protein KDC71_19470 [Acidobacteria bacterium]|nr:hypothetical protein [Acidobacteriota bacterium]